MISKDKELAAAHTSAAPRPHGLDTFSNTILDATIANIPIEEPSDNHDKPNYITIFSARTTRRGALASLGDAPQVVLVDQVDALLLLFMIISEKNWHRRGQVRLARRPRRAFPRAARKALAENSAAIRFRQPNLFSPSLMWALLLAAGCGTMPISR